MKSRVLGAALLITMLPVLWSGAQRAAAAIPPIRPLGQIIQVSRDSLTYIASIRVLSDGRVLANDTRGRRVVLFDSSLAHFITIVDTTSETARAYGTNGGWLFPFTGDSSLFADFAALSFLVIDPAGKIRRQIAAPLGAGGQLAYLTSAAIDPQGRVLSKWTRGAGAMLGMSNVQTRVSPNGTVSFGGTGSLAALPPPPDPSVPPVIVRDSTVILRVNIETKKIDTAVWLMAPPTGTVGTIGPYGPRRSNMRNLIPVSDAWAMLPDGTVAAVREYDYHVDWLGPNGMLTSTPKIAHEWQPLTDSIKVALIDSVRGADSASAERMRAHVDSQARASDQPGMVFMGSVGGVTVSSGGGPLDMPRYLSPDELPSYFPPFPQNDTANAGPVRADADGNLWIRVNLPKRPEGGFVYDIVNRQGVLVDRIQIPGGTNLIGFGPGVAYLISREGVGYKLARARIR